MTVADRSGFRFGLNAADQPWSHTEQQPVLDRFEVRPGDRWARDVPTSERSELVASQSVPFDVPVTVAYRFKLETTAGSESDDNGIGPWCVLGQFRATDDPADYGGRVPVFGFAAYPIGRPDRVRFRAGVHYDPAPVSVEGGQTGQLLWTTDDYLLDIWHEHQITVQFSRTGIGSAAVTIDGKQVANMNTPAGYNDRLGPRWKYGIYRGQGSHYPLVAVYLGLKITHG